jgi:hypothetical protein
MGFFAFVVHHQITSALPPHQPFPHENLVLTVNFSFIVGLKQTHHSADSRQKCGQ